MSFPGGSDGKAVKHLSAMWETWVRSLGRESPLEKEMATHSSTLTWKIPWMEEPGRLQSKGSQRVGHDRATSFQYNRVWLGKSWTSLVTQLVKNLHAMWETWVLSLVWEDPLENEKATYPSILAWRIPQTV